MSGVSFAAWIGNYRRLRRIADTPLSNIGSAAQGYAEIAGRAEAGTAPLNSHLTHLPCLWFEFEVYEKTSDDKWTLRESGSSETPFVIRDATGTCVIDPRGAEIVTSHEERWTSGSYRYVERLLLPQERIGVHIKEDPARIQAVLDDLARRFPAAKVYLMGTSNGTGPTIAADTDRFIDLSPGAIGRSRIGLSLVRL